MERRIAARRNRLALAGVEVDRRLVDREYQIACIEALFAEVSHGRRKLLVEMATGTGKTRTAAAFVKRLFEAGIVSGVSRPAAANARSGRSRYRAQGVLAHSR